MPRPAYRIELHHGVVLFENPAFGGHGRVSEKGKHRGIPVSRSGKSVKVEIPSCFKIGGLFRRPVNGGTPVPYKRGGKGGDFFSMEENGVVIPLLCFTDDRAVKFPFPRDRGDFFHVLRGDDEQHSFLGFGEGDLPWLHVRSPKRHPVEVEFHADTALRRHLARG
ncbi:hypothetical protein SDC9_69969 [bioreactor metagenome]|uniref:Uncharacterized protein n=1 Tax=bioreactor metagenome TaxID=1076179 RepID=A0A644Y4L0_9ZZZZ